MSIRSSWIVRRYKMHKSPKISVHSATKTAIFHEALVESRKQIWSFHVLQTVATHVRASTQVNVTSGLARFIWNDVYEKAENQR